jgi:hypothetical protein
MLKYTVVWYRLLDNKESPKPQGVWLEGFPFIIPANLGDLKHQIDVKSFVGDSHKGPLNNQGKPA